MSVYCICAGRFIMQFLKPSSGMLVKGCALGSIIAWAVKLFLDSISTTGFVSYISCWEMTVLLVVTKNSWFHNRLLLSAMCHWESASGTSVSSWNSPGSIGEINSAKETNVVAQRLRNECSMWRKEVNPVRWEERGVVFKNQKKE